MKTVTLVFLLVVVAVFVAPPRATPIGHGRVTDAYVALPLHFEANQGQTAAAVQFLSRGPRHTLFLTSTEAVLALTRTEPASRGHAGGHQRYTGAVLRMAFVGADPAARGAGREELPARANYYIGNDPARWHTGVRTFASVQYQDIYPGVDLVYYGHGRNLEYDFVVAPGADATRIALAFEGADGLHLEQDGDLAILIGGDTLRMQKPTVYQEVDGARREVAGGYVLADGHQVGFQIAAYDAQRPLIIDPVLFYSTYFGGNYTDSGFGIAVDAAGQAYVTGYTGSADFPTTSGSFQEIYAGAGDAFVTKVSPSGSGLGYSTYLGGAYVEQANGIAVDALPSPNAYVVGIANGPDFPATTGAFQTEPAGDGDAFVAKIADLPAPPSTTAGKTTGGGTIRTAAGGVASFGFIVESESASGPVRGNLQYVDRASGARISSVSFASLAVSGNAATFKGTCTSNGAPCTFTVSVTDEGESGTADALAISVPGVSNDGGIIRSGNIQIH